MARYCTSAINLNLTSSVRVRPIGFQFGHTIVHLSNRKSRNQEPIVKQRRSMSGVKAEAASAEDVKGEMLEPSVANKPLVRLAALAAVVASLARGTGFLSQTGIGFVHMLAFGSWFGTLVWTSFVLGIVAFKNLPRQTFGKLQSKLFPKYFALSTAVPGILLATLYYSTGGMPPLQEVRLLGISLVCSLINLAYTEPVATSVMFERYQLENAAVRDEGRMMVIKKILDNKYNNIDAISNCNADAIRVLKKKFGKFHGISSLLNLIVLVCAVGHAWYLGGHLVF